MENCGQCGCKGIRSCYICEKDGKLTREYFSQDVYNYCYKCQKAWYAATHTSCKDGLEGTTQYSKDVKTYTPEKQTSRCDGEQTLDEKFQGGDNVTSYSEHVNKEGRTGKKCQDIELGCPNHAGESIDFPGIFICCDFISDEEETSICDQIYKTPFVLSQSGRRKQDYGPKVNFKRKKLKTGDFKGLPPYSKDLYEKMKKIDLLSDFKPVELCNLEYSSERGSSIDPHFDDFWLWGERLVTLNLLSDSVLCFTCENLPGTEVHVPMYQRSLLIVYGPARCVWKHAIHRNDIVDKRIAITFRELSEEFKDCGPKKEEGNELLDIALTFNGQALGTNITSIDQSEQ